MYCWFFLRSCVSWYNNNMVPIMLYTVTSETTRLKTPKKRREKFSRWIRLEFVEKFNTISVSYLNIDRVLI